jgi:hypothetical protein
MCESTSHALGRGLQSNPDCSLEGIHLARLYAIEDRYNFLRLDPMLQRRISDASHDVFDLERGGSIRLYHAITLPLFESFSPLLGGVMGSGSQPLIRDLFIWATIMGNRALVEELWPRCSNPLRMALLGSATCREIGRRINWGRHEVTALGEEMEGWVIGVLNGVPNQEMAHRLLARVVHRISRYSVMEMAMHLKMKRFINHRYCQSLMDRLWCGSDRTGMPRPGASSLGESYNYFVLLLRAMLPGHSNLSHLMCGVCGMYGKASEGSEAGEGGSKFSTDQQGLLFEVMARTLKIARQESLATRNNHQVGGAHAVVPTRWCPRLTPRPHARGRLVTRLGLCPLMRAEYR